MKTKAIYIVAIILFSLAGASAQTGANLAVGVENQGFWEGLTGLTFSSVSVGNTQVKPGNIVYGETKLGSQIDPIIKNPSDIPSDQVETEASCDGDTVWINTYVKDPWGNIVDYESIDVTECTEWDIVRYSMKMPSNAEAGVYSVEVYIDPNKGSSVGSLQENLVASTNFEVFVDSDSDETDDNGEDTDEGADSPPDSDYDGVPDSEDECPDTYGTAREGCPIYMLDDDDDGVPNNQDRCPDTYAETSNGCPVQDRDNDGVPDSEDECPSKGDLGNGVMADGCPITEDSDSRGFIGRVIYLLFGWI